MTEKHWRPWEDEQEQRRLLNERIVRMHANQARTHAARLGEIAEEVESANRDVRSGVASLLASLRQTPAKRRQRAWLATIEFIVGAAGFALLTIAGGWMLALAFFLLTWSSHIRTAREKT
jgi:hypothetical protein